MHECRATVASRLPLLHSATHLLGRDLRVRANTETSIPGPGVPETQRNREKTLSLTATASFRHQEAPLLAARRGTSAPRIASFAASASAARRAMISQSDEVPQSQTNSRACYDHWGGNPELLPPEISESVHELQSPLPNGLPES